MPRLPFRSLSLPLRLDREWSELMRSYAADHQHPVNQACHTVGIPLIAASLPVAMTVIGLPAAITMWSVGWAFQFVGHAFEGKQPSFVEDKRALVVGLLWWAKKVGVPIVVQEPGEVAGVSATTAARVAEAA
jgi:uncharacterized membrane protein YGL010W